MKIDEYGNGICRDATGRYFQIIPDRNTISLLPAKRIILLTADQATDLAARLSRWVVIRRITLESEES